MKGSAMAVTEQPQGYCSRDPWRSSIPWTCNKVASLSANGLANFTPTSGVLFEVSVSAARVRPSFRLRSGLMMSCTQFALNGTNISIVWFQSISFQFTFNWKLCSGVFYTLLNTHITPLINLNHNGSICSRS